MKQTLLEKAKHSTAKIDIRKGRSRFPEKELLILGWAWLDGEISTAALTMALGRAPRSSAGALATAMNAVRRGRIKK